MSEASENESDSDTEENESDLDNNDDVVDIMSLLQAGQTIALFSSVTSFELFYLCIVINVGEADEDFDYKLWI